MMGHMDLATGRSLALSLASLACGGAAPAARAPAASSSIAPAATAPLACDMALTAWAPDAYVDLYLPGDVAGSAAPIATLHRAADKVFDEVRIQVPTFAADAARPRIPVHLRYEGAELDAAVPLEQLTIRGAWVLRPGLMVGPNVPLDLISADEGSILVEVQVPGAPARAAEQVDVPCAAFSTPPDERRLAAALLGQDDAMVPMLASPAGGVVRLHDAPGGAHVGDLALDDQTVVLERAGGGRWTRLARFSDDASIASVGWTDAPGLVAGSTYFWDSAGRFGSGARIRTTLEVTVLRCPHEVPVRLRLADEEHVLGRLAPGTPLRLARAWEIDRAETSVELAWLRPTDDGEFVLAPAERAGCVATTEQLRLGD
jgi:hypothetical protein